MRPRPTLELGLPAGGRVASGWRPSARPSLLRPWGRGWGGACGPRVSARQRPGGRPAPACAPARPVPTFLCSGAGVLAVRRPCCAAHSAGGGSRGGAALGARRGRACGCARGSVCRGVAGRGEAGRRAAAAGGRDRARRRGRVLRGGARPLPSAPRAPQTPLFLEASLYFRVMRSAFVKCEKDVRKPPNANTPQKLGAGRSSLDGGGKEAQPEWLFRRCTF